MSHLNGDLHELEQLLNALCDEHITRDQLNRLESILRNNRQARQYYLQFIDLHGMLYWDTAKGWDAARGAENAADDLVTPASIPHNTAADPPAAPVSPAPVPAARSQRLRTLALSVVSVAVLVLLAAWLGRNPATPPEAGQPVANNNSTENNRPAGDHPSNNNTADAPIARGTPHITPAPDRPPHGPISPSKPQPERGPAIAGSPSPDDSVNAPQPDAAAVALGPHASPIELIDWHIRAGWEAAGIEPSPRADDSEWLRRVYLDLAGHIPPVDVAERFLSDQTPGKRERMVDQLLDSTAYVSNWSTIWGNLLVGRSTSRDIDRPALQRFLRNAFASNRPWNEVVYDLVAAEGDASENGAANFLLAHLNNEAVPATAITARVFMSMQVQCTQCHDHKLNNWKQNQFWELNCFFQQTDVVRTRRRDSKSGRMVTSVQLVSKPVGGPIYYETRQQLLRAAYPKFAGIPVSPEPHVNRRSELAKLMTSGDNSLVARSLVNRLWEHFLGAGFTSPVDDLGPHNPPSHPQLLDQLSREFVRSGYDVKQLMRWICKSEPYQLSSRFSESNTFDNPSSGEIPLFSRVYIKAMTAEQLYDSVLVASQAQNAGVSDWDQAERRRRQWMQPFIAAYETDENDEASLLDGSLPQALLMMNGDLTGKAVSTDRGTFLHELAHSDTSETEKIQRVFLSVLSRYPTVEELSALRGIFRQQKLRTPNPKERSLATVEGLKDLFWASLNSSEFVLIY